MFHLPWSSSRSLNFIRFGCFPSKNQIIILSRGKKHEEKESKKMCDVAQNKWESNEIEIRHKRQTPCVQHTGILDDKKIIFNLFGAQKKRARTRTKGRRQYRENLHSRLADIPSDDGRNYTGLKWYSINQSQSHTRIRIAM